MTDASPVAIVTGASSGIGRACAIAFDKAGYRQVLVARNGERLAEVAAELATAPAIVTGDVADADVAVRAREAALQTFGQLDILLANAGLYLPDKGWEVESSRIDTIGRTNVLGVMHFVHEVLPHMVEQGRGDIIVTSSVSGQQVIPWEPVYSATKHAVKAFVHGTRQQLVGTGVRIGAIAPGKVLNELWGVDEDSSSIEAEIAAGNGLHSDDVADAVMYMLNAPRHMTIRDLVMLPTNQEI